MTMISRARSSDLQDVDVIVTTTKGVPGLIELLDLKSFKLVHVGELDIKALGRLLCNAGAGYIAGDFAWIYEQWLRREAADPDAQWKTSFEAFLNFARSKCWFDEHTAAVRAHIEWGSRDPS